MILIALVVGAAAVVIFAVCVLIASWGYEPDDNPREGSDDGR